MCVSLFFAAFAVESINLSAVVVDDDDQFEGMCYRQSYWSGTRWPRGTYIHEFTQTHSKPAELGAFGCKNIMGVDVVGRNAPQKMTDVRCLKLFWNNNFSVLMPIMPIVSVPG